MQKTALLFLLILNFQCSGTSSRSGLVDPPVKSSFEATTPCNITIRKILGINEDDRSEMMKWNLTLDMDPKKLTPTTFKLVYEYGIPKQGTRGFMDGSKKVELNGNCTIEKGIATNETAIVLTLTVPGSPVSLAFFKPDDNILHLLDNARRLMVGSAAWSYTLNRKDPVLQNEYNPIPVLSPLTTPNTDTVGIFEGRTPCNHDLTSINDLTPEGCQGIKCQLILLQDVLTHTPATFILRTVYVGKGDNKYSITGKWKMMRRSPADATIIYQLVPDPDKSNTSLLLLKGDDNILFFVDNHSRLLVGNNYCSYTLNKKK